MPSSDPHRRHRSRSPLTRPSKGSSGFRWKSKPSATDEDPQPRSSDPNRDTRTPRRRSQPRSSSRSHSRPRYRSHSRSPRREHTKRARDRERSPRRESRRFSEERGAEWETRRFSEEREEKPKKEKKQKKSMSQQSQEPTIIVNVNDRLGTKAAVPCLASDPIRLFKAMVAARIGREPHEIMLKRQGERPFKDQLTLEDYGVSNGVQLDLEVDTGD